MVTVQVATASLNGTIELLCLCAAGAYLAHHRILNTFGILILSKSESISRKFIAVCT